MPQFKATDITITRAYDPQEDPENPACITLEENPQWESLDIVGTREELAAFSEAFSKAVNKL